MFRTATFLGLLLPVLGVLSLSGCSHKSVPVTHPTAEILVMEQQALDMVNSERATAGLSALVMDGDLTAVARAHSEDMVARSFFAHINPDGRTPFQRIDAGGIKYVSAGENIAFNTFPATMTADTAIPALVK